ncbi:MAG: hypothetical protein K9M45_06085 [Kiritimatiellales bacterium]|nr:hypothetical protein [Kiritimatiellales bacterium]
MKKFLLGLAIIMLAVSPAFCEEEKFDLDKEMEHIELQRAQTEFQFDQEMRNLELQERRMNLDRMAQGPNQKKKKDGGAVCLIIGIIHILMAVWVYQDVRKKNKGNGIWIVITLLAGFFGASVYALIRLGDCNQKEK